MTKRKLSLQQRRRIAQQRAKHDSAIPELQGLSESKEGEVVAHFGSQALVRGTQNENPPFQQRCYLRANLDIATGDRVVWRSGEDVGIVERALARESVLKRPDNYGKLRTVAANISQIFIVIAPTPLPHSSLIDRYFVAATLHKLPARLLINKFDLLSESDDAYAPILELERRYSSLGYAVMRVSAKNRLGFDALQAALNEQCSIFVGQSGVGKSSLIQTLLPEETLRIGDLSADVAKGKHTTTHAQLFDFPSGGKCVDSPGIREFGLWHATPEQVVAGFPEIAHTASECQFRDCTHSHEPGCAVQAAIRTGEIDAERFSNLQLILNQLDKVTMQQPMENHFS